jgi:hypothetical protein
MTPRAIHRIGTCRGTQIASDVLALDTCDNAVVPAVSTVDEQGLSAVRGSSHPVLVRRAPYRRP